MEGFKFAVGQCVRTLQPAGPPLTCAVYQPRTVEGVVTGIFYGPLGEYYDVLHEDGFTAPYNPEELELLSDTAGSVFALFDDVLPLNIRLKCHKCQYQLQFVKSNAHHYPVYGCAHDSAEFGLSADLLVIPHVCVERKD